MKIVFIFTLALIPSLLYFLVIRVRAKQRFQARLRQVRTRTAYYRPPVMIELSHLYPDYPQMQSDFIGETSCRFNAHSSFLRCAVNPSGPCENCSYYEPKE